MGFLFRSEMFFRRTQELEYLFFLSREARNPPFKLNGRSLIYRFDRNLCTWVHFYISSSFLFHFLAHLDKAM
jgi:hypothetical protein